MTDSRDDAVEMTGLASARARQARSRERTTAWSQRWRELKFVRPASCAIPTSGTARSSQSAEGAGRVMRSYRDPPLPRPPFRHGEPERGDGGVDPPRARRGTGPDQTGLVGATERRFREIRETRIAGVHGYRAS